MSDFSERIAHLSSDRLSLLAIELRAKLEEVEANRHEPIAIVGMSCRFPGSPDVDNYWRLVDEGQDAISQIPSDRFDIERYYDPSPQTLGRTYARHGGFIQQPLLFDAGFFGLAPREAESMDPQQRLLMEASWLALEDAGLVPSKLVGSATGVYVGLSTDDYMQLSCRHGGLDQINPYTGTGCSGSVAAGRISHFYGFEGPNLPIDTACSSSLVGVHLACQNLRDRKCDLALAGGVNVLMAPDPFIYFCKVGALSPDGTCKTFDASANGYVRGEGVGMVVLKRMSDAVKDGDRILAVVRGSAINHDGRSGGLTVPNRRAQAAVIRDSLADSGLDAAGVDYVEAHGTGTRLGDPIELRALGEVYGEGRTTEDPLLVGAVKTNIGHLEAAAGIAGLIKAVLMLRHQKLAPSLHFQQPNPFVPWNELPIEVVAKNRAWPQRDRPLRAGVSSFGFSGTNAHIIVEQAPQVTTEGQANQNGAATNGAIPRIASPQHSKHLLCLSARCEQSLRDHAANIAATLTAPQPPSLADVAFTLNNGRSSFEHRLTVVASTHEEAAAKLLQFSRGESAQGGLASEAVDNDRPKIAFLFTGQGSQYPGMGKDLYDNEPVFRQTLDECAEVLQPLLEHPLLDVMYGDRSDLLDQTSYTQPALYALEFALAQLWRSWGVTPSVVMGHSVGEYVAAAVAGILDWKDGLRLIAQRARLMHSLPAGGAMAALFLSEELARQAIAPYGDALSIAAINGPSNIVISGQQAALDAVLAQLAEQQVKATKLPVSHAFHSSLLDPMLSELEQFAGKFEHGDAKLDMVSNLHGRLVRPGDITPVYWSAHARQPVLFEAGVGVLNDQNCNVMIEIGPGTTMLSMAQACSDTPTTPPAVKRLPSVTRGGNDEQAFLQAVQELHAVGATVEWPRRGGQLASLPSYPFQRQHMTLDFTREWVPVDQLGTDQLAGSLAALPSSAAVQAEDAGDDRLTDQSVEQWLYDIYWDKVEIPAKSGRTKPGHWLLLGGSGPLADQLEQQLLSQGATCCRPSLDTYSGAAFDELLEQLAGAETPLTGCIHLASLDAADDAEQSAVMQACAGALHLSQALLRRGVMDFEHWFVTSGGVAVSDQDVADLRPLQAVFGGMGVAIAVEQERWFCNQIDLAPGMTADESATVLTRLLTARERESRHAIRSGRRYLARLKRRPDAYSEHTPSINADGTYLITGGLGDLGMSLAKWLVDHGARHLVLVSRRSPDDDTLAAIAALEQFGARVNVRSCDIADAAAVKELIASIEQQGPALRGVLHCAGVNLAELIPQLEWSQFENVLRPKVTGTQNLQRAMAGKPLDFNVYFSSMASILPGPGQTAYGAANAFLDAQARVSAAEGQHGISINWAPWAEAGMAKRLTGSLRRRWKALGMPELVTADGLQAFASILSTKPTQMAVMPFDWNKLFPIYPPGLEPPILKTIAEQERKQEPPSEVWLRLAEQIRKAAPQQQAPLLEQYVEAQVSGLLGHDAAESISRTAGFFELGFDSLMMVELRNRLQTDIGFIHSLPATVLFEAPSIRQLAVYLQENVLQGGTTATVVAERRQTHDEPIAIVGIGCRLPGESNDVNRFWESLQAGRDAIEVVPKERWDVDAFYDSDPNTVGKMYAREGGFLKNVDRFDNNFFGISAREASRMDPQQRLLLEVVWEALESSSTPVDQLPKQKTGMFVGISGNDYVRLLAQNGDPAALDAYLGVGNALSIAAGRLSFFLGTQGPTMALDTACSSSLVAVHLACKSLRDGDSNVAFASGVNLILTPETSISLSKAQMLSMDSRCKTFDAAADGYVRSEGCGAVMLKRLSDAVADGDEILATIRGTTINHDGRSGGLTVPNGQAQKDLLHAALADSGLGVDDVDYVEAHGTGTRLGDPIELRALGEVYGEGRTADDPLLVGAVKTNIGHLEAAAGVAGLIKTVLMLRHKELAPSLHFQQPNPFIPWNELPIEVVDKNRDWPQRDRPLRAGVSSFGFSGTNAHIIVEQAPQKSTDADANSDASVADDAASQTAAPQRSRHLLCLSARCEQALRDHATNIATALTGPQPPSLADVAFTLNTGRSPFEHRLTLLASTHEEAAATLLAFSRGETAPGVLAGEAVDNDHPKIAFLFTGQGSQYPGMGKDLYDSEPVFRQTLDECAEVLQPLLEHPLLDVMYGDHSDLLNQTSYTQPALYALEFALAQLWRSWGVTPSVVMGHSVGEYVAAAVAGILDWKDGLRLIAQRARLMHDLPAGGAMAALFLSEELARQAIAPYGDKLSIAAINGPSNVVISGQQAALDAVVAQLAERQVKATKLPVSHAFHSSLLDPMLSDLEQFAGQFEHADAQIEMVSNLHGRLVRPGDITPAYWAQHARQAVLFEAGVDVLDDQNCNVMIEIGPGTTLLSMAQACGASDKAQWLPSLRKSGPQSDGLLPSLQRLFVIGAAIDWKGFHAGESSRRVALPFYPFQRTRHWLADNRTAAALPGTTPGASVPSVADENAAVTVDATTHAAAETESTASNTLASESLLIGSTGIEAFGEQKLTSPAFNDEIYQFQISSNRPALLDDHRIYTMAVVPGAFHVATALTVMEKRQDYPLHLQSMAFPEALILPDDEMHRLQLVMTPTDEGHDFRVFANRMSADNDGKWTLHAAGKMADNLEDQQAVQPSIEEVQSRCTQHLGSSEVIYRFMHQQGLHLGNHFRWIDEIWLRNGESISRMRESQHGEGSEGPFVLHPGLMDSCYQTLGATFVTSESDRSAYIPINIERLTVLRRPTKPLWVHAKLRDVGVDTKNAAGMVGDLVVFDEDGVVIVITGLRVRRASHAALRRFANKQVLDSIYSVEWRQTDMPTTRMTSNAKWLIFGNHDTTTNEAIEALTRDDPQSECHVVYPDGQTATGEAHLAAPARAKIAGSIDPNQPESYEAMLDAFPDSQEWRGVIFLWSASQRDAGVQSWETYLQQQQTESRALLYVVQSLHKKYGMSVPRLWVLTRGARAVDDTEQPDVGRAGIWGMCRVLALEHPMLRCVRIDLDGERQAAQPFDKIFWATDREDEIAFRGGQRYVARLSKSKMKSSAGRLSADSAQRLARSADGRLNGLSIVPASRQPPREGEIEIRVTASGLNFRDVLNALGVYPGDAGPLGGECSGHVVAVGPGVEGFEIGDPVAAIGMGTFASFVTTPAVLAVRLPDDVDLLQAAAVPVAYVTSLLCLDQQAKLKAGDSVLVHAGAGGVGIAAIRYAIQLGATVYATAGNDEKRALLKAEGVTGVFDSRSLDFSKQLLQATDGRGVDVVLNSLAGDFIPASIDVLKQGGVFVEIGKRDIWTHEGVREYRPDVGYHIVALDELIQDDPKQVGRLLAQTYQLINSGACGVPPMQSFAFEQAAEAFRFMAQAKHIGKIVLAMSEDQAGTRRAHVTDDANYLITGGLGALGLHTARWLVSQGAKHVALVSRRGASEAATPAIQELQASGARVTVHQADVSKRDDVKRLVKDLNNGVPLRGVFHAAGVLSDKMLVNQDWDSFVDALAGKVGGALHLHELTQDLEMDYFVLYSSAAALLGFPSQGNYAAANATLDALADHRRAIGQAALSVNWGPWAEAGMAAKASDRVQQQWSTLGVNQMAPKQGVSALAFLLEEDAVNLAVMDIDWTRLLRRFPESLEPPLLSAMAESGGNSLEPSKEWLGFVKQVSKADPEQRKRMVVAFLQANAGRILESPDDQLPAPTTPLNEIGFDSLMLVEWANELGAATGTSFSATTLFDYPTIDALAGYLLVDVMKIESPAEPTKRETRVAKAASVDDLMDSIEGLSDDEASRKLRGK